jgi:hypothetical protein
VKGPDLDPVATMREFREYLASSYEPQGKIAARVGVTQSTILDWLAGKPHPMGKSLAKLREEWAVVGR